MRLVERMATLSTMLGQLSAESQQGRQARQNWFLSRLLRILGYLPLWHHPAILSAIPSPFTKSSPPVLA